MVPLVRYCLHQAGPRKNKDSGPVYAAPLVLQRATDSAVFEWNLVRYQISLCIGAKALGGETLRTEGDILTDIARSLQYQNPISKT